jgi:AraC-like DNA-binding protein
MVPMTSAQSIRHIPIAPLNRYIECFWWSRRDEPLERCEHMLPSGSAQLVFALHDVPVACWPNSRLVAPVRWSGSVVHGPQSRYYIAGAKPRGTVVGVSFRPGAAGALLGVPLSELLDRHITLDALWGQRARDLHEQLSAATDGTSAFRILERSLSARVDRPLLMHPAVAQVLASWSLGTTGPVRIADIERDSGFSAKHFISLFRAAVGLAPKHYYRIRRFNAVLSHISATNGRLAYVAACTGYSDQAHMTREFREFAGVAPSQYRPSSPTSALHHRTSVPDEILIR